MDRRFIIFILVSVVVLYSYNYFINKNSSKSQPAQIIETTSKPEIKPTIEPSKEEKLVNSINPNDIVHTTYENSVIKAVSSNFGAKIENIILKKFKKEDGFVDIISNFNDPSSFTLNFDLNKENLKLNEQIWNNYSNNNGIYSNIVNSGLNITKNISFKDNYYGSLGLEFGNLSKNDLNLSNIRLHYSLSQNVKSADFHQVVIFANGKLIRLKPNKKDEMNVYDIANGWVGIKDHYFCLIFKGKEVDKVIVQNNKNQTMDIFLTFKDIYLKPSEKINLEVSAYFGPQDYSELSKSGYKFNKIVDFGFFNSIGVAMLYCLKFFYQLTKNYGFSIILLTLLIRAILWWPTQKSYTSMKKMQTSMNKMQPRLKTLKEVYKNDPQKLNEETMKLYKEYQINPAGGCLPMLLQMPIFFALYSTLNGAVELKGANFIWFWTDLSAKDPFYVLPILMGVTMFIQQKMSTPPAATPEAETQQKMMLYLMPAMLTFFAFMWPSGLLVYWVVSNIASIVQQVIINRQS